MIIAHRGASGHRPEHTLGSYRLAAELGADCIEPDLVSTKDGVLVARHEPDITQTTDVADHPEFSDRPWRTEEFTLAELKTLRARERIPNLRPANTAYDGRFEIPTFDEVLALAAELGVAVYPETKHPSHFRSIGLALEERLVAALERTGVPAWVQSFEADSLRRITLDVPRVRLISQPADLGDIATYADAVGPLKSLVTPRFVEDAHAAGLQVHAWTFRAENEFLPPELRSSGDPAEHGDLAGELTAYLTMGVDGFFTDHPGVARQCLPRQ